MMASRVVNNYLIERQYTVRGGYNLLSREGRTKLFKIEFREVGIVDTKGCMRSNVLELGC